MVREYQKLWIVGRFNNEMRGFEGWAQRAWLAGCWGVVSLKRVVGWID
ncbi:hypothetical protein JD969_19050 [Planctomycetota bacterium]|nr:hypothetical protein JD969_19050 [Planctomycetota bacterium]